MAKYTLEFNDLIFLFPFQEKLRSRIEEGKILIWCLNLFNYFKKKGKSKTHKRQSGNSYKKNMNITNIKEILI